MIVGKSNFLYLSKAQGVTKDGEKYLALAVLDDEDRKHSFITRDDKLISELSQRNFAKYSDIVIHVGFSQAYNKNRYSYWSVELIGVE